MKNITKQDIRDWLGNDVTEQSLKTLVEIANKTYTPDQLIEDINKS